MRIKEILEDLFKDLDIYLKIKSYEVLNLWDRVVGEYIAKNSCPEHITNGILYVKVKNSLWLQELVLLKNNLIESLNKGMGMEIVKDIHFKIGKLENKGKYKKEKQKKERKGISREDIGRIERVTSLIKDEEIREIIKRVMKKEAEARIMYKG